MAYYGDYDTYVVPGFSGVTLGGCRNFDSFDLKPNKFDFESIKSRCEALVPSLNKAQLIDVKVGLRPHRDPVRVDYEFLDTSRGIVKIVHNYGHGGYGGESSVCQKFREIKVHFQLRPHLELQSMQQSL